MSQPHNLTGLLPPDFSGQTKTMFLSEGDPHAALLIETLRGGKSVEVYWFTAPDHALAWCRKHGCRFVYLPLVP